MPAPGLNLNDNGVALDGYDVVSYHTESEPRIGSADIAVRHQGAEYHFASSDNRDAFVADPERYLPAYGGWCAVAVSENKTFGINPETYSVEDGQLYLFYNGEHGNTKPAWEEDRDQRRSDADNAWDRQDLILHHLEVV